MAERDGRCPRAPSTATLTVMSVIDVTDLRKAYGGRPAVAGVSFSVEEGEIFGRARCQALLLAAGQFREPLGAKDRAAAVATAYDRGILG